VRFDVLLRAIQISCHGGLLCGRLSI
jgi:hypothetical protein